MSGWSRRFLAQLGAMVAIAAYVGAASAATNPDAASIVRLSQRNEPADLDPATATLPDEFFIIRALGEGLVILAEGGNPVAATAESWEISADGLVYTFHLRPGLRWSNGDALTAADFVASYRRLLTPATAAPKADLFFAVKNAQAYTGGKTADFSTVGFRAPDALTLVITLERPTPHFLLYVASGPWIPVPPRVVERFGRTWTRPENHVGNGPFVLTEWRANQRIVVRTNPAYREPDPDRVGEIQFVAFNNGDTEERAYRGGQIDVTMAVPVSKLDTYTRERPAELLRTALAETHYLTFNTRRVPLNDARVRRALALAIDRSKIVDGVLRGGQEPADRLMPPQLRDNADRENNATPSWAVRFDPEEARRLLASAGFAGGKGFPRLEITSWARPAVLEAVQAMWKQELGIEIAIALREAKVHADSLRVGGYDIGFITLIPDVPDPAAVLADFITGAPGNYPRWSSPAFDTIVSEAASTLNDEQRAALLLDAERRLIEPAIIAPLYFNAKNWLMSPRIRGWREDALWSRDYRGLRILAPQTTEP
jgi:oligopeptide transport system substrate-binding protein